MIPISPTYLPTVALHAVVLSVLAAGLLAVMRRPGQRAFVAMVGLSAIAVLPWITALRPGGRAITPAADALSQQASPALPTWTIVTVPASQEKEAAGDREPVAAPDRFSFPEPMQLAISVWALGTGAGLLLLAGAMFRVIRWRRSLLPVDNTAWKMLCDTLPDVTGRHLFRISNTSSSPCVTGFLKPRIVLPRFLLERGASQQLLWAVGHETAHLRAGDSRWMIVFSLIRCVNWWNPLVHRLVSQWADSREQLCDLYAAGASGNRADYGEFLVTMARQLTKQPPLAVAMAKRPGVRKLKQRILCLLESGGDVAKPVGKAFIGFSSALFVTGAVLVSALRIGAEEAKDISPTIADAEPMEEQTEPAPEQAPALKPDKQPKPRSVVRWTVGQQLKFTTKMLVTPAKPVVKEGALLSDQEIQLYMRSLNQKKGVDLMTAPSVTSRSGEQVEIQVIRHVPPREGQKTPKETVPFVGISMTMAGKVTGNTVDLKFDADYRFVPGGHTTQLRKEEAAKINPDDIRIVKHSITSRMGPGQTTVSYLGEIEPGRFLHILVTAVPVNDEGETLDAFVDGKPVDPPAGSATAKDAPAKQEARPFRIMSGAKSGKVRLNAVVIDLPRDPKLPDGQRYYRKLSPAADDTLNALVQHYRLEKRKLKQVEIPLNGLHVPWPEFPGIRLSAVTTEDMATFALTNDSEENGTSSVTPMNPGDMVHIDVRSGDPAVERRVYITAIPVK